MRARRDLVVPIRDRRQRRRILTLRNFRNAVLAIAIVLLGVTIYSDLPRSKSGEYGRLFDKQVASQKTIAPRKYEPVPEAPVEDQTAADPMLVFAAAREQYLGNVDPDRGNVDPALSGFAPAGEPALRAEPGLPGASTVTGPNGIKIVVGKSERHPTLSGGIFRQ